MTAVNLLFAVDSVSPHRISGCSESAQNSNLEVDRLFAKLERVQTQETIAAGLVVPATVTPDNPPWDLWSGFALWVVSVVLILFVPVFTVLPYAARMTDISDSQTLNTFLTTDKLAIILNIAAIIPAHILTILFALYIVRRASRNGFFASMGWDMGTFRLWQGVLIIVGFFAFAAVVAHYFPEQDNQLLKLLRSSREVTILVAIVATFSAPLVEEIVYRGVLYPAARKSIGSVPAIALVTFLFTLVHVPQYYPSFSTIFLLLTLSLILTIVRARTGRLLPCVVLHFVFNAIQSALLVAEPYLPKPPADPAAVAALMRF
jgi:hypothetical protein